MITIFLCKLLNIDNSVQNKTGQDTALEMVPDFASTNDQIRTKNTNLSRFFTRPGRPLPARKYLKIYFQSAKIWWQRI